jgi:hypothetical protein
MQNSQSRGVGVDANSVGTSDLGLQPWQPWVPEEGTPTEVTRDPFEPPDAPEGWEWVLLPERPGGAKRAPGWHSPGETGHYSSLNPEPIQVFEAWGLDGLEFAMMKYAARYKAKGKPVQDLEKVQFFAGELIKRYKREASRNEHTEQS